jgi:hypothetical protein
MAIRIICAFLERIRFDHVISDYSGLQPVYVFVQIMTVEPENIKAVLSTDFYSYEKGNSNYPS